MNIGILDYNACNISSIYYSVYRLGYDPKIIKKPNELKKIDKLIIPGVGAAKHCLDYFRSNGIFNEVNEFLISEKPILGICLGLQIFSKTLYEHGISKGFGLINAEVVSIKETGYYNIGWAKINLKKNSILPSQITKDNSFYFCHSYCLKFLDKIDEKNCLGYLNNGTSVPSIVIKNNFIGVQFHPEKSQKNGENIIKYFLNL